MGERAGQGRGGMKEISGRIKREERKRGESGERKRVPVSVIVQGQKMEPGTLILAN